MTLYAAFRALQPCHWQRSDELSMMATVDHIAGHTFHSRKGAVDNAFRYSIDYVLCDGDAKVATPLLFGRNQSGLMSLQDSDHGGTP